MQILLSKDFISRIVFKTLILEKAHCGTQIKTAPTCLWFTRQDWLCAPTIHPACPPCSLFIFAFCVRCALLTTKCKGDLQSHCYLPVKADLHSFSLNPHPVKYLIALRFLKMFYVLSVKLEPNGAQGKRMSIPFSVKAFGRKMVRYELFRVITEMGGVLSWTPPLFFFLFLDSSTNCQNSKISNGLAHNACIYHLPANYCQHVTLAI